MLFNLTALDFACLIVTGAVAGYISGMFGLGGGVIMTPVLFELLPHIIGPHPLTAQIAIATSLGCVFFSSVSSAQAHNQKGNVDWKLAAIAGPLSAAGSFLVTQHALKVSGGTLKATFGIFLAVMALRMWFFDSRKSPQDDLPLSGAADYVKVTVIGLLVGVIGAMFGIGGGSLAVPAFVLMMNKPVHRAVGTSAVLGACAGLVGSIGYLLANPGQPVPGAVGVVIPAVVLLLAMVSIPLAQVSARHASRTDPQKLRHAFSVALLIIGLFVVFRTIHK